MNKTIKAIFYGEPGVGKSVFAYANGISKPFFICTDDNYAYLEDWGAKEEDHIKVESWKEAKDVFNRSFDDYDTIVVDLIEDLYLWCEEEYIRANKITDLSDLGYGKGYKQVRKDFFLTIKSLINKSKNIILLTHGVTIKNKDKRGVEYLKFAPSDKISEKLWTDIVGCVRYCLRCYATPEEDENGNLTIKRYLSLSPDGTTEYGVIRGIPDTNFPPKIPLDWKTFIETVGLTVPNMNVRTISTQKPTVISTPKVVEPPKVVVEVQEPDPEIEAMTQQIEQVDEKQEEPVKEVKPKSTRGRRAATPATEVASEPAKQPVEEPVKVEAKPADTPKSTTAMTKEEKIAEIKRKLAAAKAAKQ